MSVSAAGVIQADPAVDPSRALESAAGTAAYLFQAAATAPGTLPLPEGDRAAAGGELRRACPEGRIVVLYAEEALSTELAEELRTAVASPGPTASYRAPVEVHLLGRRIASAPVVVAWDGDPTAAGPVVDCRGVLVRRFASLEHAIATLDDRACRAAYAIGEVSAREFLSRPAGRFIRRVWRRRADGSPGFILSVLETYQEILTAGKVWERAGERRHHPLVPRTFRCRETPAGLIAIRSDLDPELERLLVTATPDRVERGERLMAGRGATWVVRSDRAPNAIVRWYRRGGLPSRIARDTYVGGRAARPLRELAVTEQARARGIPVPEVLAVRVDRVGIGRYRGAIMTREIPGGATLDVALGRADVAEQERLLAVAARALRRMHDLGLQHPDLNASNVLLVPSGQDVDAFVIDLDRARMTSVVSSYARRRGLRRLDRSLSRVPGLSPAVRATVGAVYWRGA